MAALAQLVETIQKFGEVETYMRANELNVFEDEQVQRENVEKTDAKMTAESNKFLEQIMGGMNNNMQGQQQQMPQHGQ